MTEIKVKLSQGTVRGCEERLPDGRIFQRFSRIPYAHVPIGQLRFRDPKKLMKFEANEIDCTDERDFACFHRHFVNQTYVGSEDCLYLNVYVPEIKGNSVGNLPVMVYIHGGKDLVDLF
jgi:cholinesterase